MLDPNDLSPRQKQSLKHEELRLKQQKLRIVENLPHRYAQKHYHWSRAFFESTNRLNILTAANQIGKSSTNIKKCIEWATNMQLWPKLWKSQPKIFFYLYPSKDVANVEIEKKWIPDFLPRNEFREHPQYGWKLERMGKDILAIHFFSGVSVYFKTYAQSVQTLQTGTCHAIFCFVAGTRILTRQGLKKIEEITLEDQVYSHEGWRRVSKIHPKRDAKVITRSFSDGRKITATPDHPFWTKRGWVQFQNLTSSDQLSTVPGWKMLEKLSYLTDRFMSVSSTIRTFVCETIRGMKKANSFTLNFGRRFIRESFLRDTLFITEMGTLSTIDRKIWSFLREPSTRDFINLKNGGGAAFIPASALNVAKTSNQGVPRSISRGSVRRNVGSFIVEKIINVSDAVRNFWHAKIRSNVFVLDSVQIEENQTVYNLEVEGAHTYFAEGFLVHNCDEELPEELLPELQARLFATDGYFHLVFTATLNQQLWWRAMHGRGEEEMFPDAFKLTVSMYDCIFYEDGTPGPFTRERIHQIEASCKSDAERRRRVLGHFVKDEGLKYQTFNPSIHFVQPFEIPREFLIYSAVDLGGGGTGHPAAINFIATQPNHQRGYSFINWRGDGVSTTSGDVLEKYRELRGKLRPVQQCFDHQAKDFGVIASRMGESFVRANKSHQVGEDALNNLFRTSALLIFDDEGGRKFGTELLTMTHTVLKVKAKDDLIDANRYNVCQIPWDWDFINRSSPEVLEKSMENKPLTEAQWQAREIDERRAGFIGAKESSEGWEELERDFEFWNDEYGN